MAELQNEGRHVDIDLTLGDDGIVPENAAGSASKKKYVPFLPPSRPHIQPKPDDDAQFRMQLGNMHPAQPGFPVPHGMQGYQMNHFPGQQPQLRAPVVQQQQQPMPIPMLPANQGASWLQSNMSHLANVLNPAAAWNALQQQLNSAALGAANQVKLLFQENCRRSAYGISCLHVSVSCLHVSFYAST
jgi:hypothetical protein